MVAYTNLSKLSLMLTSLTTTLNNLHVNKFKPASFKSCILKVKMSWMNSEANTPMINGTTQETWYAKFLKPHFPSFMNVCTTRIQRVIQINALIKSAPPTSSMTRKILSTTSTTRKIPITKSTTKKIPITTSTTRKISIMDRSFAMKDSITSAGCTLSWIRLSNSTSQPHQIKNNGTKSDKRSVNWTKQVHGSQQSAFRNRCPQKT